MLGFEDALTIETDVALVPGLAAGDIEELEPDIEELEPDIEELEPDIEELEPDIAGFWTNCNVSVETISGTILIRRCALLVRKSAVNCS